MNLLRKWWLRSDGGWRCLLGFHTWKYSQLYPELSLLIPCVRCGEAKDGVGHSSERIRKWRCALGWHSPRLRCVEHVSEDKVGLLVDTRYFCSWCGFDRTDWI